MISYIQKASKTAVIISILLLGAIGYLDLVTGYDLGFFVFYFIPISVIAWYSNRLYAILVSLAAAVAWLFIDQLSGHPYSNWTFPYWNAFVRWTSFVILAITISQIKLMFLNEQKLKHQLEIALMKRNEYLAIIEKVAEGDEQVSYFISDARDPDALDKTFMYLISRLSEQKILEQKLNNLERQAMMAETASYFAHEIRNPLNLIMLTAYYLGTQFTPEAPAQKEKFDELIKSLKSEVDQLSSVVTNFLSIGKQSELNRSSFSFVMVVDQVRQLVHQQLLKKRINLIITGDNSIMLFADIDQIRLVLLNLMVNAIAAINDQGRIWIHTKLTDSESFVTFSITDDGPGIATEIMDRIFEPYFSGKTEGTGLGLALVERVIEAHSGSIYVKNRPEGGAVFTVKLPVEKLQ